MLGAIRQVAVNFAQMVYDIGWGGAEASQLKWKDQTEIWIKLGYNYV